MDIDRSHFPTQFIEQPIKRLKGTHRVNVRGGYTPVSVTSLADHASRF